MTHYRLLSSTPFILTLSSAAHIYFGGHYENKESCTVRCLRGDHLRAGASVHPDLGHDPDHPRDLCGHAIGHPARRQIRRAEPGHLPDHRRCGRTGLRGLYPRSAKAPRPDRRLSRRLYPACVRLRCDLLDVGQKQPRRQKIRLHAARHDRRTDPQPIRRPCRVRRRHGESSGIHRHHRVQHHIRGERRDDFSVSRGGEKKGCFTDGGAGHRAAVILRYSDQRGLFAVPPTAAGVDRGGRSAA